MEEAISKLKATSLSQAVRDELVRLITSGTLKPGARLNEVHLAEKLGVSRGPVREAARELEGLGLTVSRPRQGFYVADYTDRDIREIYEVSWWIHRALIDDFLVYSNPATLNAIEDGLASIDASNAQTFSETLLSFRERMLTYVNNRYLAEHALALYRRFFIIAAIVRAEDSDARLQRILATQQGLWTALRQGDRAEAESIMRADIDHWMSDLPPRFSKRRG